MEDREGRVEEGGVLQRISSSEMNAADVRRLPKRQPSRVVFSNPLPLIVRSVPPVSEPAFGVVVVIWTSSTYVKDVDALVVSLSFSVN